MMPKQGEEDFYKKSFLEHIPKKDQPLGKDEPERVPENITQAPPTTVGGAETTRDAPKTPVTQEGTPSTVGPAVKHEAPPLDLWEEVGQVANMYFNDAARREKEAIDEATKTTLSDKAAFLRSVREAAEFAKDQEGFNGLLLQGLNSGKLTSEEFATLGQTLAGNGAIEVDKETGTSVPALGDAETIAPQERGEPLKEPEELLLEEDKEPPPQVRELPVPASLGETPPEMEVPPVPELTLPVEPAPTEEVPVAAPETAAEAPAGEIPTIEIAEPAPVEAVAPPSSPRNDSPASSRLDESIRGGPVAEEVATPPESETPIAPTPTIEEVVIPAAVETTTPEPEPVSPAPEAVPAPEYTPMPIDIEFTERFGIFEKDLFTIPGYNKLSEGHRRMVYTNLEQISLGRVKETALEREREEAAGKGLLKRIVHNAAKKYQIKKQETASAKELAQGGIEVHRAFLTELVRGAPEGPEAWHRKDGSFAIEFASLKSLGDLDPTNPFPARGDPLYDAGARFNNAASNFAQIPQEWEFAGTRSQKKQFKEAQKAYEEVRGVLIDTMVRTEDAEAREQYMLDLDQKVRTQQFFNTHPEAEQELTRILGSSKSNAFWNGFIKSTLTERGIISAAGALTRTGATYTSIALGSAVIGTGLGAVGAGALGGALAYRRGKQELARKAYGARHGAKEKTTIIKNQEYKLAEGEIVHLKHLETKPGISISSELKDQIRDVNHMDEGPEKDALLATLQNKAGGLANVSLKDEVSVQFGGAIFELLTEAQFSGIQKICNDINRAKSEDIRDERTQRLEQFLKGLTVKQLTNAPVEITYEKGAAGVLAASKLQKGIETALGRINDPTLDLTKRIRTLDGLDRLLRYGQILMQEGSIDYGAGPERIRTRLAFASALTKGLSAVAERDAEAIVAKQVVHGEAAEKEIKKRATGAVKTHEKAASRRRTKFLAKEVAKGVVLSGAAFVAGRWIRGLFIKGTTAAEYQSGKASGKAAIKSIKSLFSKDQNKVVPRAGGTEAAPSSNTSVGGKETVTIAKLKEPAGVETAGKGESVKIASLKESAGAGTGKMSGSTITEKLKATTQESAEAQKPARLEMKIGRRGPQGSIIDAFKQDGELAMKFGWDGKTDLSRWAGKRAHTLWRAHADEALAQPETKIQMKKLGFTPDLKGYGEMMQQIKGGMVEFDPQTGKVDLGDMEYFKAKAPRIAEQGVERESMFRPPRERGLSAAEFDAAYEEVMQPLGEKIPETELPSEAIDPAMENLRGNVKYFFEPREGVYDTVWPKLKDIPIKKLADVIPGGKDALDYYQENGSLRIPLPRKQGGVVDIYGWRRADKIAQLGDFLRRINLKKYGNLTLEKTLAIMSRKTVTPEFK